MVSRVAPKHFGGAKRLQGVAERAGLRIRQILLVVATVLEHVVTHSISCHLQLLNHFRSSFFDHLFWPLPAGLKNPFTKWRTITPAAHKPFNLSLSVHWVNLNPDKMDSCLEWNNAGSDCSSQSVRTGSIVLSTVFFWFCLFLLCNSQLSCQCLFSLRMEQIVLPYRIKLWVLELLLEPNMCSGWVVASVVTLHCSEFLAVLLLNRFKLWDFWDFLYANFCVLKDWNCYFQVLSSFCIFCSPQSWPKQVVGSSSWWNQLGVHIVGKAARQQKDSEHLNATLGVPPFHAYTQKGLKGDLIDLCPPLICAHLRCSLRCSLVEMKTTGWSCMVLQPHMKITCWHAGLTRRWVRYAKQLLCFPGENWQGNHVMGLVLVWNCVAWSFRTS